MKLEKRHFEFLADVLSKIKDSVSNEDHFIITTYLADRLSETNPLFDWQKFVDKSRNIKPNKISLTR